MTLSNITFERESLAVILSRITPPADILQNDILTASEKAAAWVDANWVYDGQFDTAEHRKQSKLKAGLRKRDELLGLRK
jgi:hypothetical protein